MWWVMSHAWIIQGTHRNCNTLQRTATHCNKLQQNATKCNDSAEWRLSALSCNALKHTATHSWLSTPHHAWVVCASAFCMSCVCVTLILQVTFVHMGATHRNTLQHTATHCSTLQHIAAHCSTPSCMCDAALIEWVMYIWHISSNHESLPSPSLIEWVITHESDSVMICAIYITHSMSMSHHHLLNESLLMSYIASWCGTCHRARVMRESRSHTATHLQQIAIHCNKYIGLCHDSALTIVHASCASHEHTLRYPRTYGCNTLLLHTATHCNPLQPTETHCNPLQHTLMNGACTYEVQHTRSHCNSLLYSATHCNTLA